MPAHVSEAIVLRTYPFQEADSVVSFLTRDLGKLRGVARRARRPKNRFGSGLERLSHVQMAYFRKETRELVSLDSCELIHSPFHMSSDYETGLALDFMAEVTDQVLPTADPNERHFRLLLTVLEHLRGGTQNLWRAVTYFGLWSVRLAGLLPELHVCHACGVLLDDEEHPQRAFFRRTEEGLCCPGCRRPSSLELTAASRAIADEMLRTSITQASPGDFTRATAGDLRQFLHQRIENHIERRLLTAPQLEAL